MLRLLRGCDERGQQVALHSPYFGPGLLATMHFITAADQSMMLEYYDADWLDGLPFGERLTPVAGRISLPDGDGLGMAPCEDRIAAQAIARGDITFN